MYLKIIKVLIIAAIAVTGALALIFPASAAAYEWDGLSPLQPGNVYEIPEGKTIYVTSSLSVPKDAQLNVRGTLIFTTNSGLDNAGFVGISRSGLISLSGSLIIREGAKYDDYGNTELTTSSVTYVLGELTVYRQGQLKSSGKLYSYPGSKYNNRGITKLLPASVTYISGSMTSIEGSEFQSQGEYGVTLGGSFSTSGYMVIGRNSVVRNSGKFVIAHGADFSRFGELYNTASATFSDLRDTYAYEDFTVSTLVDEPETLMHGIDVSYANGNIDWAKVKAAGIEFAYIRAARGKVSVGGSCKVDDFFVRNVTEATRNGIPVGVYMYSYATNVEQIKEEAKFLVDTIKPYNIQFPVCLDMEEEINRGALTKDQATAMVEAFFGVLMENGYFPIMTSYKSWFERYLDMRVLDKYAIWLAQYSSTVTYQGGYYIWQYSCTGRVSGVNGDVDLDIAYRNFPAILSKKGLNHLS